MVKGVVDGFEKKLEIVGVGYRAEVQGKSLRFHLGYSHPITFDPPEGVSLSLDSPTLVSVSGVDKEKVGQAAGEIGRFGLTKAKGSGIKENTCAVRRVRRQSDVYTQAQA
jgi:large subunit ribosomal protein L6